MQVTRLFLGVALVVLAGTLVSSSSAKPTSLGSGSATLQKYLGEEGQGTDAGGWDNVFGDPEEVAAANPFMARNKEVGSLHALVDDLRDKLMQMYGDLKARAKDQNCDGIHRIATEMQGEQSKYKNIATQFEALDTYDRQDAAAYVQLRLSRVGRSVEQMLISELLRCEKSTGAYSEAVAGVSLVEDQVRDLVRELEIHDHDCPHMEKTFEEFSKLMGKFYRSASRKLDKLRAHNMLVAMDKADLELEARMAPIERSFFETFHSLWNRHCRPAVDKALDPPKNKKVAKESENVKLFQPSLKDQLLLTVEEELAAATPPPSTHPPVPSKPASFPEGLPKNARIGLLVALVLFLASAVVFLYFGVQERNSKLMFWLIFFVAATGMCSYLASFTGFGVHWKLDENTWRAIFWPHWLDLLFTVPILVAAISLVARSENAAIGSQCGSAFFMIGGYMVGASVPGSSKWGWWGVGLVFALVLVIQLANQFHRAKATQADHTVSLLQLSTGLAVLVLLLYPVIWVLGSEGVGYLSLTVNVGILVLLDLALKLGIGFAVLTAPAALPIEDEISGESRQLLAQASANSRMV